LVCAICHFAGEASGIDCTLASASDNGAANATVMLRVRCKAGSKDAASTDDLAVLVAIRRGPPDQ
jgi:hypothetical protein